MVKSNDPAQYKPMAEKDARLAFRLAIGMNIHSLPQLKGKGKPTNLNMDHVVEIFSTAVYDHVMSNCWLFIGPPDRGSGGWPPKGSHVSVLIDANGKFR